MIAIWIAFASVANTTEYDGNEPANGFEAFYRTGSIIFGGGQVASTAVLRAGAVPRRVRAATAPRSSIPLRT